VSKGLSRFTAYLSPTDSKPDTKTVEEISTASCRLWSSLVIRANAAVPAGTANESGFTLFVIHLRVGSNLSFLFECIWLSKSISAFWEKPGVQKDRNRTNRQMCFIRSLERIG